MTCSTEEILMLMSRAAGDEVARAELDRVVAEEARRDGGQGLARCAELAGVASQHGLDAEPLEMALIHFMARSVTHQESLEKQECQSPEAQVRFRAFFGAGGLATVVSDKPAPAGSVRPGHFAPRRV